MSDLYGRVVAALEHLLDGDYGTVEDILEELALELYPLRRFSLDEIPDIPYMGPLP